MNVKSINRKSYIDWEEYFRLRDEEHLSDVQIAKIFSIGESTLKRFKKDKKVKNNRVKITVDWVQYDYLIRKGLTNTEIAKKMGINLSTLSQKKKQRAVC